LFAEPNWEHPFINNNEAVPQRQKNNIMKTIATIVLSAALIGGAVYWVKHGKGPGHEEVIKFAEDPFQWDSGEIRQAPELWYRSARRELTGIRQDLANARFGVEVKNRKWQNSNANAKAKIKSYTAFLAKAKPRYNEAEVGLTWPVSLNDRQFDRTKLQSTIVRVHRDLQRERKRARTYTDMVDKAQRMSKKLTGKLEALVQLDLDLALGQEMASMKLSLDQLSGLTNRGADIEATAAALEMEMAGLFDADLSFADPQGGVDEATFAAIMNEGRVEVSDPIEKLD
jgi:hypothetical protein